MTKNKKPMTSAAYVKAHGAKCPSCRSDTISAEPTTEALSTDDLYQTVRCIECGSRWTERYKLIGYDELSVEV